jgi:hypothetical protein
MTTQQFVSRQVSFYPPIGGGKYHATTALHGDEIAMCRAMVLDRTIPPIIITPLTDRVHPIVCRRCLAINS